MSIKVSLEEQNHKANCSKSSLGLEAGLKIPKRSQHQQSLPRLGATGPLAGSGGLAVYRSTRETSRRG